MFPRKNQTRPVETMFAICDVWNPTAHKVILKMTTPVHRQRFSIDVSVTLRCLHQDDQKMGGLLKIGVGCRQDQQDRLRRYVLNSPQHTSRIDG